MAKKIETPYDAEILAALVAEKMAAGLPKADAVECAERQLKHDQALADAAKAAAAQPE